MHEIHAFSSQTDIVVPLPIPATTLDRPQCYRGELGAFSTGRSDPTFLSAYQYSFPAMLFVSLGLVALDEIRVPNQNPVTDLLGDSGVYGEKPYRLWNGWVSLEKAVLTDL